MNDLIINTSNDIITPTKKKYNYINPYTNSAPKTDVLFTDFINLLVLKKAKRYTKSYVNSYKSLITHILNFCIENNCDLYTNSITDDFIDDFILYLESKNLKVNTIKGLIEKTKGMSRKASTYGFAIDPSFNDIQMNDEESFSVFLSMNDITRIYYYKGLTKAQEKIKDLFIIGCLTALRYSDYSTLDLSNFQKDYIIKVTKKTKKKVCIPMHDYVKEIIKKYDNKIPCSPCIQYFNKYLKLIMKKIGFDEKVTYSYTKGGKLNTSTKEKWEMISSHTARRSAATNMYLTGRMKTYEIMQLTGHTTEKNFFKYIKVTSDDNAKAISGDVFFRK